MLTDILLTGPLYLPTKSNETKVIFLIFFLHFTFSTRFIIQDEKRTSKSVKMSYKKVYKLTIKFGKSLAHKILLSHDRPQGYKTFFMLNSTEHKINTKIPKNEEVS